MDKLETPAHSAASLADRSVVHRCTCGYITYPAGRVPVHEDLLHGMDEVVITAAHAPTQSNKASVDPAPLKLLGGPETDGTL